MIGLTLASGIVALGMAWAIGAQDVSNALGTAVGSKAITVQQAIIIGAICEFAGALIGGDVAQTISKGIVNPDLTGSMVIYSQIMFCTLFGAFIWLAIATLYALPVSTSHSLVGSLIGLGLTVCPQALNSSVLSTVIASWIISPTAGAVLSYIVFYVINRFILQTKFPLRSAQNLIPYFWGFTVSILTAFSTLAGPSEFRLPIHLSLAAAVFMFVLATTVASKTPDLREKAVVDLTDEDDTTERAEALFIRLMIATACVVSFAHGSNDVSNSIGPFAAIIEVYQSGSASGKDPVPFWILVFGGFGIVLGLATYGYKVMATIGEKITKLTYSRGFAAQIATALTVLTASVLGLSVSTTHCLIGAIAGLALVEGNDKVNKGTLKRIAISWIVTLPASASFSLIIFGLTKLSPL